MPMAVPQPPDDEQFVTRRDLQDALAQLRTELMNFIKEHCATKADLAHCATKADVERAGRVLAFGLIGGISAVLVATLAGMWGVVHTLVALAP